MGKCLNFILDIALAWSLAHTNTVKDAYAAFAKRHSLKKCHRLDVRYYQNDDETVIIDGAAERDRNILTDSVEGLLFNPVNYNDALDRLTSDYSSAITHLSEIYRMFRTMGNTNVLAVRYTEIFATNPDISMDVKMEMYELWKAYTDLDVFELNYSSAPLTAERVEEQKKMCNVRATKERLFNMLVHKYMLPGFQSVEEVAETMSTLITQHNNNVHMNEILTASDSMVQENADRSNMKLASAVDEQNVVTMTFPCPPTHTPTHNTEHKKKKTSVLLN